MNKLKFLKFYEEKINPNEFNNGEDWDDEEIDPNEDKVYKSNEQGVCPACGSNDLSYEGHPYIEDDEVYYQWLCRKCKFIGLEYYTLRFDEHYTADGIRIRVGEPIDKDSYDN